MASAGLEAAGSRRPPADAPTRCGPGFASGALRKLMRPPAARPPPPQLLPRLEPALGAADAPLGLKRRFSGFGERTTFPRLSPLLVQIEDLLSAVECRDLIAAGAHAFSKSHAGVEAEDPRWQRWRTCAGAWISDETLSVARRRDADVGRRAAATVKRLEAVVAKLTKRPVSHQEPLHIVRYRPGEEYRPHMDVIPDQSRMPCGPRVFTVLVYGNDVACGGATEFPLLDVKIDARAGRAIVFNADDDRMLHAGAPVVKGEKYVFIKWVHENKFADD